MDVVRELEALRRDRAALGRRGRGRPYPEEFAARVRRVAVAGAMPLPRLRHELGISAPTLAKWLRSSPAARLLPVEIAPAPLCSSFIVHGPAGLRIEGLGLDDLAELLRRLA